MGIPLPLHLEAQRRAVSLAALLGLAGGFLLRYFVVCAGQAGIVRL